MSTVTYAERWNSKLHKPIGVMTVDHARARDQEGQTYVVLVGEPTSPEVMVEVNWTNDYLGVWFFDDKTRRYLKYSFTRVGDQRLFLSEITNWDYPPEATRDLSGATLITKMTYQQDGTATHRVTDNTANEVHLAEYSAVPLDINWEPIPAFGDWVSVARRNREAVI